LPDWVFAGMAIEQYSRSKLEAKICAEKHMSLPCKSGLTDDGG
jgi:hypothetical protein